MPTDPYTGTNIDPGTATATCPHGHVNRADSWEAGGNRCSYPGCGYAGRPTPGYLSRPAAAAPAFDASRIRIINQSGAQPPASYGKPVYPPPTRNGYAGRPAVQRSVGGWVYVALFVTITLIVGGVWLLNQPHYVSIVTSGAGQGPSDDPSASPTVVIVSNVSPGLDDGSTPAPQLPPATDTAVPLPPTDTPAPPPLTDTPVPPLPTATPVPLPPVNADLVGVHMLSPDWGWAVGWGGTIYHYNYGRWEQTNSPVGNLNLVSVFNVSSDDAWAVGDNATILHYSGGQWTTVNAPVSNPNLHSIFMLSPAEGWAVGDRGTILHYNGSDWQLATSPTAMVLWSVYMISPDEGWAVGGGYRTAGNVILHYQSGSWNIAQATDDGASLHGLVMTSASEGWAVGDNFTILHYDGQNWNKSTDQPVGETIWGITMVSPTEGWAVGGTDDVYNSGGRSILLHYINNSWVTMSSPASSTLYMVSMTSPNEGWAVGADGVIHYQNGTWSQYPLGCNGYAPRPLHWHKH